LSLSTSSKFPLLFLWLFVRCLHNPPIDKAWF
jgi:hypothetical protein